MSTVELPRLQTSVASDADRAPDCPVPPNPPDNTHASQNRRALMQASAGISICCTLALLYEIVVSSPVHAGWYIHVMSLVAGIVASGAAYFRADRGHPRQATFILGLLLVLIAFNATVVVGLGLRAPIMVLFCVAILGVNFSAGPRAGRWVLGIACASLSLLLLLEDLRLIPGMSADRYPPAVHTFVNLLCLYVCAFAFSRGFQDRSDQALQELASKNADLQQALHDREKALDEKARAQAAKDRFLATMSHEIRTPMAGIRTAIALLQNPKVAEAARARYLSALDTTTESLLRLLNDLLDTSQLEAGALNVQTRPVALESLVQDTIALFELSARQKKLALHHDIQCDPSLMVNADPARLRQMLSNLLGNAVKFTQTGHIRVDVTPVINDSPNTVWMFRVTDTGPGITETDQQRLFLPFSQLDHPDQHRHGGSGLGLSIVRRLAETMGGSAGVVSAPGEGSCFWFTARLEPVSTELRSELAA